MSLSRGQMRARGGERDLDEARAIETERGLAAPQIRHAEKALRHGDEIRLAEIERRKMRHRHMAPERVTAKRSSTRAIASRAPSGSASSGGSLIDGPGKANVRSAITL